MVQLLVPPVSRMYQIRLASGEVTVYRSVEELALGIHSGTITPEAQVYHKKTDRWVPVIYHPDYKTALARQKLPARASAAWERLTEEEITGEMAAHPTVQQEAIGVLLPEAAGKGSRVRAGLWIGLAAGAGFAAVFGYFLLRQPAAGAASPEHPKSPAPVATMPPAAVSPPTRAQPSDSHRPPSAPIGTPVGGSTPPAPGADTAGQRVTIPPVNLIQQLGAGTSAAASELFTGAAKLELDRAVDESRLANPDSVRVVRKSLASLRKLITGYRTRAAQLERAYRDTALAQQKAGWTSQETSAWNSRAISREAPEAARATDSLWTEEDKLLELLTDQAGRYQVANGFISFADLTSADRFTALRDWLSARAIEWADAPPADVPPPLAVMLGVIRTSLPSVVPRPPDLPTTPATRPDTAQ